MAIYAIGDVQGCYRELQQLLEHIAFDERKDRLWFAGDLVNRGPESLAVLRFVKSLGQRATIVLGNHDLHLLATAHSGKPPRRNDTFHDVLSAPDRDELLTWLRQQALFHHDQKLHFAMVHAGLPPQWNLSDALRYAAEVEACLKSAHHTTLLEHLYGNQPDHWSDDCVAVDRLRYIINALTRIRYCTTDGRLALKNKGKPGRQPKDQLPWFDMPTRASRGSRIIFGHWSTLMGHRASDVYPLDTGCIWGGALTAIRVDGDKNPYFQIDCATQRKVQHGAAEINT
ncbi:MAG: symmetrical bis(5'-nucleosyl)-tetraphosphatase [Gammaproteobacteria bacterium]|nr:symmetrical bis(5'-nucleosyl)-tetraphosphatase [Gammaproteobacteria bacterium]